MRILLTLIASAGLVSCVGGIDKIDPSDDGNDNGDNPAGGDLTKAKELFSTNVYPIAAQKCSGGGCHSETASGATLTRFVATKPEDGHKVASNYTALVGNFAPSSAPILTMIKPGTHKLVTYTADEEAKIVEWLTEEVSARNGAGGDPPAPGQENISQAAERTMQAFAGCMTRANFDAANMANAWGNLQAQNNTACKTCHTNGGHGFIASQQADLVFETLTTRKNYWLQYFTVKLDEGPAAAKVIINEVSFKGVALGQDPHREHPRFNPTQNQGMNALKTLYDTTMTAVTAGGCTPGALK